MKASLILLALYLVGSSLAAEPSIVFDNRPLEGVPLAALAQQEGKSLRYKKTFQEMTRGTIKTVRIRYFNKKTWKTEQQVREYLAGFFAHKSLDVWSFQVWSQSVGVPEVECVVEFSDEHLAKLRRNGIGSYRTGRLLIWHTESCFRDASGKWSFVNVFDHFHRSHPTGNRKHAKKTPANK